MASPPEAKIDAKIDALSKGLLVALALLAVVTFDDFGLTWDEGYHIRYGDHLLDYYTSGFEDTAALTYRLDYLYGGGFDLLGAIFREVAAPMGKYTALHLFGSLIGVLGIAGAWRLGRAIGGARVGLYALVMLALTHVYYGHMFNNPKDLPFAVGYIWGLHFVCEAIRAFPRLGWRLVAWLALALGMAMSVRIAGLLLICYLLGVIGVWALRQGIARRSFEALYRHASGLYLRAGVAIVGAWSLMLLFWPWAQQKPLTRPFVALTRMSKFLTHRRKMPFDGEWIDTLDTPPDYLLHYFGYKLPELVLGLFVVGTIGGLCWILARGWRLENTKKALIYGTLGLAVLLPPAYAVYKESVLYDGLRHFLFLVPPIAVIAALTFGAAERWLRARLPRAGGAIAGGVLALFVADHLRIAIVYHPHHYVWFNRILGGLAEADGVYSTDYYGETFREALVELDRELRRREPERFADTTYRVSGCMGRRHVIDYLSPNFIHVGRNDRSDFWVGYARDKCSRRHTNRPAIVRVEREGGFLNVVRDLRRPSRRGRQAPEEFVGMPGEGDEAEVATSTSAGLYPSESGPTLEGESTAGAEPPSERGSTEGGASTGVRGPEEEP